jgi:mRNA interferase MazF
MRKWAIVLIPFPFTDLSGQKIRPAIVVNELTGSEDCIVVFISSVKETTKRKYSMNVKATSANGLKVDSVVKVSKIATLQKKSVIGEIGMLGKTDQMALRGALQNMFL